LAVTTLFRVLKMILAPSDLQGSI